MQNALRLLPVLLLLLFSGPGFGNETPVGPKTKAGLIISGKIYDTKSQETLAGVKIVCSNCSKTFYSGLDGRFFIYLETDNATDLQLEFSQVGYSSRSIAASELQRQGGEAGIDLASE